MSRPKQEYPQVCNTKEFILCVCDSMSQLIHHSKSSIMFSKLLHLFFLILFFFKSQDEDKSHKKHKHKKHKDKDRVRDDGSKEKGEKKKKKHRKKDGEGENAVKNEMNELEAFLEGPAGNYEAF